MLDRTPCCILLALAVLTVGGTALATELEPHGRRSTAARGVLEIVQSDDFAGDRTERVHRLVDEATGRTLRLRFRSTPDRRLRSGDRVVVRGQASGDELLVDDGTAIEVVAPAAAAAAESRAAVVLVVDFADSAVSCPDTQIAGLMFDDAKSVDGLFQASSHGLLSFPRDTDGDGQADVFRVSVGNSVADACDAYGWAAAAETAATAAGVDLALYRHRVLVLPGNVGCGWAGLGNVGCGTFCRAWVKTCGLGDVYAHELSHNLGMAHASTDTNNDGQIDCEYCDRSDPMGYGGVGWRVFNGAHDDQMDWLPAGQIVELSSSGTTTEVLSPLQLDPSHAAYPQVLKIAKPDSGDFYYLTYRQRDGYDSTLDATYVDRTNIHRYVGSGYENTLYIGALADGETFEDAANGIVVTQLSHDAVSATIQIGTSCTPVPAGIAIAPASQAARPGQVLAYQVTVTNNDSSLCGASNLDLAASAPPGWIASLDRASVTLAPGAQDLVGLSVTSRNDEVDGDFGLTVDVSDAAAPAHDASGAAEYKVDQTPPDAVDDLAASIKRKTDVQLAWSLPFDGGAGVAEFDVLRDGALLATTGSTSYHDRSTSSGETYEYVVIARDDVGNESAASNVASITVGSGGNGGGKGGGGNKEICDDGIDNDGDGQIDCSDSDCRRARACR